VGLELEARADDRQRALLLGHAGDALPLADRVGKLLAAALVQERFLVEQVVLRKAAGREGHDDALRGRLAELVRRRRRAGEGQAAGDQAGEGDRAEAHQAGAEEGAAREVGVGLERVVHGCIQLGSSPLAAKEAQRWIVASRLSSALPTLAHAATSAGSS